MLAPANIGQNELLTQLPESSSENWGFHVVVTWLLVIMMGHYRVTWRQQLHVCTPGEGVTASISVQRRVFFASVDRFSHTWMEPILCSVFHHNILHDEAGGHLLGKQGAGAPSAA